MISNSSDENHPDVFGHDVTSSCASGGNCCSGTRYSCGIESASAARFAAATFSQLLADVISKILLSMDEMQCQCKQAVTINASQITSTIWASRHGRLAQAVSGVALSSDADSPPLWFPPRFTNDTSPKLSSLRLSEPRPLCNYATTSSLLVKGALRSASLLS